MIPNHSKDLQILQNDQAIADNQGMSHFVQEVFSTVGNMFMLSLQSQDSLPARPPKQACGVSASKPGEAGAEGLNVRPEDSLLFSGI